MSTQDTSLTEEIFYPSDDGEPMAENDQIRDLMFDLIKTLDGYFQDQPDVYVSGNILVYYREGNPRRCVAPDVLVVRGVPKKARLYYQTWVEGKGLDVVIELSSPSTFRRDIGFKTHLYFTELGVKEFFLFDVSGKLLPQGPLFVLVQEDSELIERQPDARGRLKSEVLGLELAVEEGALRFYDPATAQRLPTPKEQLAQAQQQAAQAQQQAEEAQRQATEARQREDQEIKRRQAAEEALRKVEEELRKLRG